MDLARIFIFSVAIIIALYKSWKEKKEIYLLVAIALWLSLFYVGAHNFKQSFQEAIVSKIDTFSLFLLLAVFTRYFLVLFKGMNKK